MKYADLVEGGDFDGLESVLKEGSSRQRKKAMKALRKGPSHEEYLRLAAQSLQADDEEDVRREASKYLARIDSPTSTNALRVAVQSDPDDHVRRNCVNGLRHRLDQPDVTDTLLAVLAKDEDTPVCQRAADALSMTGDPRFDDLFHAAHARSVTGWRAVNVRAAATPAIVSGLLRSGIEAHLAENEPITVALTEPTAQFAMVATPHRLVLSYRMGELMGAVAGSQVEAKSWGFEELDRITIIRGTPYSRIQVWGQNGLEQEVRGTGCIKYDEVNAWSPHIERINADIAALHGLPGGEEG